MKKSIKNLAVKKINNVNIIKGGANGLGNQKAARGLTKQQNQIALL